MKYRISPVLRPWVWLLPLALGGAMPSGAAELQVAVASNFAPTLRDLAPAFAAHSGHRLRLSPASTGKHYAQIVHGAPFDVFFAADVAHPQRLEQQGRGVPGSRITYATGRLLLWSESAEKELDGRERLAAGRFRHLVIANPRHAPYGQAAQQVLQELGYWSRLQGRLIRAENIAQAHQYLLSGQAELGFIAAAQWQRDRRGAVWPVPKSLHQPLRQQALILRASAVATALWAYLKSAEARGIIAAAGYENGE